MEAKGEIQVNKSILITGCSSGIGLRAAEMLAARGYRVFATARKLEDVAKLKQKGFESLQLDVNDSHSINNVVPEILKKTQGTLYALLNSAGYGQSGAIEDISRDALRAQFETNVFGLQELTNKVIPVMRAQGYGRIIQISSLLGFMGRPYSGVYNASKYAVEGLADTLRLELHDTHIFVSLIEPGPIISNFVDNALAAYKNEIDIEKSAHKKNYEQLMKNMQNAKGIPFALPPDAVVKKIIRALESRNPKPRYFVTFPTYLLTTLKRILPSRAFDGLLWKIFQIELRG
jgi:short-subunit dehydrogenase